MARLTKEMREYLIRKGRRDIIEGVDINISGYAGILSNGNIVSRLEYPNAMPLPKNSMVGIPKPKRLRKDTHSDYVCLDCGIYFLTPEQAAEGGVHTAHMGKCGVCDKNGVMLHIRHYNWLIHYKYKPKKEKRWFN